MDEPDGKDSGGELAMEEEVVLETKFPAKEHVEPEDAKWLCKAAKIWGNASPKAWNMRHLQRPAQETFAEKLEVKTRKT